MLKKIFIYLLMLTILLAQSALAIDITTTGFGTAGVAQSDTKSSLYYNGNVNRTSNFSYDTKLGINFRADLKNNISSVLQMIAKGDSTQNKYNVNANLAFINWRPINNLTVNIGRQTLPVWLISDYKEIGFLYPWLRPPSEVYSIAISDKYTGINASYRFLFNDFSIKVGGSYGKVDYSDYVSEYTNDTTSMTSIILQGDSVGKNAFIELEYDDLLLRAAITETSKGTTYLESTTITKATYAKTIAVVHLDPANTYSYKAFGAKYEWNEFLFMGEYANSVYEDKNGAEIFDRYGYYGTVAYNIGRFTPVITYAATENDVKKPAVILKSLPFSWKQKTVTLGLNYKINDSANFKAEYSSMDISGKGNSADWAGTWNTSMADTKHPKLYSIAFNLMY